MPRYCYESYVTGTGRAVLKVLPPSTVTEDPGHAIAHAVACAVEAQYHLKRTCVYEPLSDLRCSPESFVETLTQKTNAAGYWNMEQLNDTITKHGIGLFVDGNTAKPGGKYRDVVIQGPAFTLKPHHSYARVVADLMSFGPLIAYVRDNAGDVKAAHPVTAIGAEMNANGETHVIVRDSLIQEDEGMRRVILDDIVSAFAVTFAELQWVIKNVELKEEGWAPLKRSNSW